MGIFKNKTNSFGRNEPFKPLCNFGRHEGHVVDCTMVFRSSPHPVSPLLPTLNQLCDLMILCSKSFLHHFRWIPNVAALPTKAGPRIWNTVVALTGLGLLTCPTSQSILYSSYTNFVSRCFHNTTFFKLTCGDVALHRGYERRLWGRTAGFEFQLQCSPAARPGHIAQPL